MNEHITRHTLWVIVVLSATIFFGTLVHALWYAPEINSYAPTTTPVVRHAVTPEDLPARLIIPALKIDAAVQYVGLNGRGEMGIPSNFTDVAWYQYGTVPGDIGSAVIDGHVDNGLGLAGVFKRLGELRPGDDVYVIRKSGERLHFTVMTVARYPYEEVPTDVVFTRSDAARLNLITCDGAWVKSAKTYDERLIVYTQLVSS